MLKLHTVDRKIEDVFNLALASLTADIHGAGMKYGPISAPEGYQRLCVREVVRGMIAARLLAESLQHPMLQDDLHQLSSNMLDALATVYPLVGITPSRGDAVEHLGKLGSVSVWKIHTRILNLLNPRKKDRSFPMPSWVAGQLKAA